jgi:hypothetical protein
MFILNKLEFVSQVKEILNNSRLLGRKDLFIIWQIKL